MRSFFALLLIATLFAGCSYTNFEDLEPTTPVQWQPNSSLYSIDTTTKPMLGDMIVEGVVVSSDSLGSFYKEIIITDVRADRFASLRLTFGFYDIYTLYPLGATLAVNLKGLVIGRDNGILTAGYLIEGEEIPSAIATPSLAAQIINNQYKTLEATPLVTSIDSLSTEMSGRVVTLKNCYFSEQFGSFAGERTVCQMENEKSTILYTSPYAYFATDAVTQGLFDITAIVVSYNDKVQLKLNYTTDILPLNKKYQHIYK